jgi:hypothetical protein
MTREHDNVYPVASKVYEFSGAYKPTWRSLQQAQDFSEDQATM